MDLRDYLYKSPAVPNPVVHLQAGHWNARDHTILFSTKKDMTMADGLYGGDFYNDRIYVDPDTGKLMFKWGGNATYYANGNYDPFLHGNQVPVFLFARVAMPDSFIMFGRLRLISWVERDLNGSRRPVVTFAIEGAPANAAAAYSQFLA